MAALGRQRLPVLGLLAAGPARRAGAVEPQGLAFYDRLVDGMLARGIAPYLTLHHWDLPQVLEDEGGWLRGRPPSGSPSSRPCSPTGSATGDRWITLNEPFVLTSFGYSFGVHAPGRSSAWRSTPSCTTCCSVTAWRSQALRAAGVGGQVGITNNVSPVYAQDPASAADRAAAERMDTYYNRQFLDPVLLGRPAGDPADIYPGSDLSVVRPGTRRPSRRRWTSSASTSTTPSRSRRPARGTPSGSSSYRSPGSRGPASTGRWCPRR